MGIVYMKNSRAGRPGLELCPATTIKTNWAKYNAYFGVIPFPVKVLTSCDDSFIESDSQITQNECITLKFNGTHLKYEDMYT